MVAEEADAAAGQADAGGHGRPDRVALAPLALLLLGGALALPRQRQLLVALLPHQLLGRQEVVLGQT